MIKKNSSKTILILGGGVMQIPSVRIAKKKGWRVIVAAKEVNDDIRRMADTVEHADLKDKRAIVHIARENKMHYGLDGVFTAGTDFSTTVSWVAEKLGLPGIPFPVALAATDKSKMRKVFEQAGVPSPEFCTVSGESEYDRIINTFPFPVKLLV